MKYIHSIENIFGGLCGLSYQKSSQILTKPENGSAVSTQFSINLSNDIPYAFYWGGNFYTLTRDPANPDCQIMDIPFSYAEITTTQVLDWTKDPKPNYGTTEYTIYC
jgi:hypothetical protein